MSPRLTQRKRQETAWSRRTSRYTDTTRERRDTTKLGKRKCTEALERIHRRC